MGVRATLGAEEELHLIDPETRLVSPRAPQVLAALDPAWYAAELQRTTIETNTAVVTTLSDLREELVRLRRGVISAAATHGLKVAAVGAPPAADQHSVHVTSSGRFGRMQDQYRLLVDEQLICGTQVHVGVEGRDLAVQIMQRVAPDLPLLLALSASSPFWNGEETGYASIRTVIWQRWPSAGATGPLASAAEYEQMLDDLLATGVIADPSMAYFDVRPSSHAPTVELRVCDACPIVDDAVLIAGLFRAMVREAELQIAAGQPFVPVLPPIHRAAIWQAARVGMAGDLVGLRGGPVRGPAPDLVHALVRRLRPHLEDSGDFDDVDTMLEALLARGSSAERQRATYADRGRLEDVVDQVIEETHGPASGIAPKVPVYAGYQARAGDEAVGAGGSVRPAYEPVLNHLRTMNVADLQERHRARDAWLAGRGVDFAGSAFQVDLVPRIVPTHAWRHLQAGLIQRSRALEMFLRDAYGPCRIVEDGVLRSEQVTGSSGWRDAGARLPSDVVRAPIIGFDLVRDAYGDWRVLEDNLRNPSGVMFAVVARELSDAIMPELPRPAGLLAAGDTFAAMRTALLAGRERGALLSSGPGSAAWYEHRRLADELGFELLTESQVSIADGRVIAGGAPVDVLYLRLDDEPDIAMVEVAASGRVLLVNAPGNGVADDKVLYRHVPELIGYYLDESPVLDTVPTYRVTDEEERRIVLGRVGELVTKPIDGFGGHGVIIGPHATAPVVAKRRREIADDPAAWVAQEMVALSSHPTFAGTLLEPRHVDLRMFAFVRGTGPDDVTIAPVALTRVGAPGSLVVNSSQGGGAKDTWIVEED